jgi:hypothetical protein
MGSRDLSLESKGATDATRCQSIRTVEEVTQDCVGRGRYQFIPCIKAGLFA